jgi:hypothetical protein
MSDHAGDVAVIRLPLTRGLMALIDATDAHLAQLKWGAQKARRTFYACRTEYGGEKPQLIRLHRAVLGITDPRVMADHRNGDGLDCRRSNLRITDAALNNGNSRLRVDNTSGFKGVHRQRSGTWCAMIQGGGRRQRTIGTFIKPEDAARAYDDVARQVFGAFAALNFPGPGERSARAVELIPEREDWAIHPACIYRGEQHRSAKLTDVTAAQALELVAAGMRQRDVARRVGVGQAAISMLVTGKTWRHLERPRLDGRLIKERER